MLGLGTCIIWNWIFGAAARTHCTYFSFCVQQNVIFTRLSRGEAFIKLCGLGLLSPNMIWNVIKESILREKVVIE